MTPAEIAAWNRAIETMRSIAGKAADRIQASGTRPLPEAFATAALRQIAADGEALLIRRVDKPDTGPVAPPRQPAPALPAATAEISP